MDFKNKTYVIAKDANGYMHDMKSLLAWLSLNVGQVIVQPSDRPRHHIIFKECEWEMWAKGKGWYIFCVDTRTEMTKRSLSEIQKWTSADLIFFDDPKNAAMFSLSFA